MKRNKNMAVVMLLLSTNCILAQTVFRNLDFEQATIIPYLDDPHFVAVSNALPHWSIHTGYYDDSWVLYNWDSLDTPTVSIHDTNTPYHSVLRGRYTAYLRSSSFFNLEASIRQTGRIPLSKKSIRFISGPYILNVRFDTNKISLLRLAEPSNGIPGYVWGGDVSRFEGMIGELQIGGTDSLDDITFSSEAISFPPPVLSQPRMSSNGVFEFTFSAPIGPGYDVQYSTNFLNWVTFTNVQSFGFPNRLVDQGAGADSRFYRAVMQ